MCVHVCMYVLCVCVYGGMVYVCMCVGVYVYM